MGLHRRGRNQSQLFLTALHYEAVHVMLNLRKVSCPSTTHARIDGGPGVGLIQLTAGGEGRKGAVEALGSLSPAGGNDAHGAHGWCRCMGVLRASAPRWLRWQGRLGCGPPRTLAPRARSRGAKERHGRGSGEDAAAAAGADSGGGAATEPAAADMERHGRHRRHRRPQLRLRPRQRRRRRKGAKQVQSDSAGTAAACPARGRAARVHKRRGPGQHPTRE